MSAHRELGPATAADVVAIAAIERAVFPRPWTAPALTAELARPIARVWVARDAGAVVGYALWWHHPDEVELLTLGVRVDARGRGHARALLGAMATAARAAAAAQIVLEVRAGNRAARALYERVGFTVTGLRRGYYDTPPDDAVLMTWRLGAGLP